MKGQKGLNKERLIAAVYVILVFPAIIPGIVFTVLSVFPAMALSEEIYQPDSIYEWYFENPVGIAADEKGYIYVADANSHCIQKFTSVGLFAIKWGKKGDGDGEFSSPSGIAIDANGIVYVTDKGNNRIQEFSCDGQFLAKWGISGSEEGQFYKPSGIATDANSFVYVTDIGNYRIQKFSCDGQFVTKWVIPGSEEGQTYEPSGIAIDANGFVYVTSKTTHTIHKFSLDGQFVDRWGDFGYGDGKFHCASGIAVDNCGFVYVTDTYNNRIQKFTSDGKYVIKFGTFGSDPGCLNLPSGLCIGNYGFVYVADTYNNRIQIYKTLTGFIRDASCRCPIEGAQILLKEKVSTISIDDGSYIHIQSGEKFTVNVKATGYISKSHFYDFSENTDIKVDIDYDLTPDPNSDNPLICLSAGLNLFGYPLDVKIGFTSYDLIVNLGRDDEIGCVQRYNPDKKVYEVTIYDPNGIPSGDEFNIRNGEGYLVYMKKPNAVLFQGSGIAKTTPFSLEAGINIPYMESGTNIISFPWVPDVYTAYDLFSDLEYYLADYECHYDIISIGRFNSKTGGLEEVFRIYDNYSDVNFNIVNGEAYLIYLR